MTEKVSLRRQDGLPMPPVSPETAEALARWYRDRLLRDLDRGERALAIACFDTAPFGFPVSQAVNGPALANSGGRVLQCRGEIYRQRGTENGNSAAGAAGAAKPRAAQRL